MIPSLILSVSDLPPPASKILLPIFLSSFFKYQIQAIGVKIVFKLLKLFFITIYFTEESMAPLKKALNIIYCYTESFFFIYLTTILTTILENW